MHPSPGDLIELEVGPAAPGGNCVARADGRVVFVRHALPGERVRVHATARGSRFWRADAVEVLVAAPERVVPPCPYAGSGRCGGCDWQHVALDRQREMKAEILREQLCRIGGLDLAALGLDVTVSALPGAPNGLGWRTRVRFAVRPDGRVGLYRHRSGAVEPVDRCLIAHPDVERIGVESLRWPDAEVVEAVAAPAVHHIVTRRRFRVTAGGFWQVHPAAADALAAALLELAAPRPGDRVLDLYAGAGLFAATLAGAVGAAGRVVAVESDPVAAADARANLADLVQARVLRARVTPDALGGPQVAAALEGPPDLIVADPPRAGLGTAATQALLRLRPRAFVYVACDGAALARDLQAALAAGYRLTGLRGFDLFPMTSHVECVALLSAGLP